MNIPRKIEPFPAFLVLLFVGASCLGLNDMMLYRPDSARYLIWAESISSGKGFVDSTLPFPVSYVIHAPLYSVLLSPIALFFPLSIIAAKFLTILLAGILLLALWKLIHRHCSKAAATFAMGVLALNPLTMLYAAQPLSDVPFALVCVLVLIVLDTDQNTPQVRRSTDLVLSLLLAAAIVLREIGITLCLAVIVYLVLCREYKRAAWIALAPVMIYALWYFRNEVIIAQRENPPLKNSALFFSHFFTSSQDSLLSEFFARIQNNSRVYIGSIARLLFSPEYGESSRSVVSMNSVPLRHISEVLRYANPLMMLIALGLAFFGLVTEFKRNSLHKLLLLFLIFYTAVLFIYPIIDSRFLFPLLIVLIYLGAIGSHSLLERWKSTYATTAAIILLALLLVPNTVWLVDYVTNQMQYTSAPLQFYEENRDDDDPPVYFTKPVALAGAWLSEHIPEDVTLCSIYKELVLYAGKRKLIDLSPMLPREELERSIRDFEIGYLVVGVQRTGLREYELQMAQSRRYRFTSLHRIADLEIIEVSHKIEEETGEQSGEYPGTLPSGTVLRDYEIRNRELFWESVRLLEKNQPLLSEEKLGEIVFSEKQSALIAFQRGVTRELSGRLDDAAQRFEEIKSIPQAGPYLEMAARHLQAIQWRKEMEDHGIPMERTIQLHANLAIQYWRLGYQQQAIQFLDHAIGTNRAPALLHGFKVLFALQTGDTSAAKSSAAVIQRREPESLQGTTLDTLFRVLDILRTETDPTRAMEQYVILAEQYRKLGMLDLAIDELKRAQLRFPQAVEPLRILAGLYEVRRQSAPLLRVLQQIRRLDSADQSIDQRIKNLESGTL